MINVPHVAENMHALRVTGRETDSECIPRRLAAGLASEYKERLPYVKIPCGLCRRVLHSQSPSFLSFTQYTTLNMIATTARAMRTKKRNSTSTGHPFLLKEYIQIRKWSSRTSSNRI